jgi:hypothetical protein
VVVSRIRRWWEGELYQSAPGSGVIFANSYHRHWTSRYAHALVNFHRREWKWAIPVYVALFAAIVRLR